MIQKALNKRLFWGTREMTLVVLFGNTFVIKKNYLLRMKKNCEPSVARDGSSEREMKQANKKLLIAQIRKIICKHISEDEKLSVAVWFWMGYSGNLCWTGLSSFRLRLGTIIGFTEPSFLPVSVRCKHANICANLYLCAKSISTKTDFWPKNGQK